MHVHIVILSRTPLIELVLCLPPDSNVQRQAAAGDGRAGADWLAESGQTQKPFGLSPVELEK